MVKKEEEISRGAKIKESFLLIVKKEHLLMFLMMLNLLIGMILVVVSLLSLNPSKVMVNVGYGDIGGYRTGAWSEMLMFPLLGVLVGIIHQFIVLRLYRSKGRSVATMFVSVSIIILLSAFFVLGRLLSEG